MKNLFFIKTSILLFFLLPQNTIAQTDSGIFLLPQKSLIIETEIENGGIIASGELKEKTFENAYYSGVNLKIGWKINRSTDQYFKLYNNPIYGIAIYNSTFNNQIVGKPFALYAFVQTPFGNIHNEKWIFDYRIGLGLSGNFKPYNPEKNPFNLAIGTKNNVFIDFGIRAQYKLNKKITTGLGLAFHHFSNGALQLPNKGVNLIPLTASMTYFPHAQSRIKVNTLIKPYPRQLMYHFNIGAGLKQVQRDIDKRFFKSTISSYVSRHISHKWRIGLGGEIFYSASGHAEEIAEDKSGKLSSYLSGGPSFYLAHVLHENLELNGNIGYYLHNQEFNGETQKIFLRAGIRYYVYKDFNAGVSIKAHKGKADYIEWTIGYTINR